MRTLKLPTVAQAVARCVGAALLLSAFPAAAQSVVTTVAGSGIVGTQDGPAALAQFNSPHGIAIDGLGNCYVSDFNNHGIRRISAAGMVVKIAGDGGPSYFDHPNGLLSSFTFPYHLTLDAAGNLYVADFGNGSIRKILPSSSVSTLAGNGRNGYQDGLGPVARFNSLTGITIDAAGNLYVVDGSNFRIRRVDAAGNTTTIAGSGISGTADGPAATAQFREPSGIARDAAGNLYIADRIAHRIRKLSPTGIVSTYAGTGVRGYADGPAATAQFASPTGLAADAAGNLYVLDRDNPRVRRIDAAGNVTTIAGTGTTGFANGPAMQAQFSLPYALCLGPTGQDLYIADAGNHRIRRLTLGPLATTAGRPRIEMSLFPNPAATTVQLTVALPAGAATHFDVLDVLGRAVSMPSPLVRTTVRGREWQLDVSALPTGVYLCRLTGSTFTQTQRLMVEH